MAPNDINANFKSGHFANSAIESDGHDSSFESSAEEAQTGTIKRSPTQELTSETELELEASQNSKWQREANRSFKSNHPASPAHEPVIDELSERLGASSSNNPPPVPTTNPADSRRRQVIRKERGNSVFYDEVSIDTPISTEQTTLDDSGEVDYDDVPTAGKIFVQWKNI